jgi:hypothetical protein
MSALAVKKPEETVLAVDVSALNASKAKFEKEFLALQEVPCVTPDQELWWSKYANDLGLDLKALEAEYRRLKDPIVADGKKIDTAFRTAFAPGERLKQLCKDKLSGPARARFEAEAAAHLALVQAGSAEDVLAAVDAIPEGGTVKGTAAPKKVVWSLEDAALVPREYLCVDEKKLNALAKGHKDLYNLPQVPGVAFKVEVNVRTTGRGAKDAAEEG